MDNKRYVIWSNNHQAWWRPASRGYTRWLEEAGCYDEAEAIAICDSGTMMTYEGKRKCDFMLRDPDNERPVGWQPIDTAPKDGTRILICVTHEEKEPNIGVGQWYEPSKHWPGDWWWDGCSPNVEWSEPISEMNFGTPTHWMQLPEAP